MNIDNKISLNYHKTMQAQVYKIHSDFYYVKNVNLNEFTCKLKETLKKQKTDICVGDFVELSEDCNFIIKRKKRINSILKPHVANIDLMLVVCSIKEPELDFNQLDRYLTYLKSQNIPCSICFNKEDLDNNLEETKQKINKIYSNLNYKTFFVSAKNHLDLTDLKEYIKNKTIALCGMSGVGKTTLLNSLTENSLKTNIVSKKTQRGQHTTRHVEIIDFHDFKIMDTPGFSCLKFNYILPKDLIELFDDLKLYKDECKYSNCTHDNIENKNCGIINNLDKINPSRFESYLCFLEETREYKEEISKKSIKQEAHKKQVGNLILTKVSKRKRLSSRKTQKQNLKGQIVNYDEQI